MGLDTTTNLNTKADYDQRIARIQGKIAWLRADLANADKYHKPGIRSEIAHLQSELAKLRADRKHAPK